MKRMAMVLVIALSAGVNEASYDRHLAQKKGNQFVADEYTSQYTDEYTNTNVYANMDTYAKTDEYATNMDEYANSNAQNQNNQNQCTIDEYDQQICDTVQPPAVSNAQILLANLAGKLFLYYLILQQTASTYLHEIKDFLTQCIHNISK